MMDVDVAVVGGGIVGLAFAAQAARHGRSVVLCERSARPEGASVRNFGMVWPIGQRPGPDYDLAMRSRAIWLDFASKAGIWYSECGSLHVAYHDDEAAVIEEFVTQSRQTGITCSVLPADEVRQRYPAINTDGLKCGLYSPTEVAVNPRTAIAQLADWLTRSGQVSVRWRTAVTHVEPGAVRTAAGETIRAGTVLICSGSDFETLLPEAFASSGIRRCKLQMMHTGPQPVGFRLGTHLAAGLTLTHYKAFESCPTLPALRQRFEREHPEMIRLGIHVMASQQDTGEITIGDSHEYDDAITPFDETHIDDLILDYLNRFVTLPDDRIVSRWSGIYAKHPTRLFVSDEIQPGVHIAVAPGGAGMTLSFGLADDWWNQHSA